MLKCKPFTVCLVIAVLSLSVFLVSFVAEEIINGNFDNMKSTLAVIETDGVTSYAIYEYGGNTYKCELKYSTALKNGMSFPVYFDPSSPENAQIKDVSVIWVMRYAPLFVLIPSVCGMVFTFYSFKKRVADQ